MLIFHFIYIYIVVGLSYHGDEMFRELSWYFER